MRTSRLLSTSEHPSPSKRHTRYEESSDEDSDDPDTYSDDSETDDDASTHDSTDVNDLVRRFTNLTHNEQLLLIQKVQQARPDLTEARRLGDPQLSAVEKGLVLERVLAHSLALIDVVPLAKMIEESKCRMKILPKALPKQRRVVTYKDTTVQEYFTKFDPTVVYLPEPGINRMGPDVVFCMKNQDKENIVVFFALKTSEKDKVENTRVKSNFSSTDLEYLFTQTLRKKKRHIEVYELLRKQAVKYIIRVHLVLPTSTCEEFKSGMVELDEDKRLTWLIRNGTESVYEYHEIIIDIDRDSLRKSQLFDADVAELVLAHWK